LNLKHETDPLTSGVTGVILAGGRSSRMGSNKALLPYRGGRFIESIFQIMSGLFPDVLLVTNTPEQYGFIPCPKVADIYQDMGALAGLHAGLLHSRSEHIFVVACDMPCLNTAIIKALLALRHKADVIIPESRFGLEPLHAIYKRSCLSHMESALQADRRRIITFFPQVTVHRFEHFSLAMLDPDADSFSNINTPAEYFQLRRNKNRAHDPVCPAVLPAFLKI
jgi:molybdopterin-guanine dinucleotide biosynthesis protein A